MELEEVKQHKCLKPELQLEVRIQIIWLYWMLMKRDDLKWRSAVFLFCFVFSFFVIRPHYYAETLSTYYDEEVVIGEGQKPAGKFYVNYNL